MDTYTGYLNVQPTAELNPFLWNLWLEDQLHGYPYAKYYLDRNQTPQSPPTLDLDRMPNYLMGSIRNDGDEDIVAKITVWFAGIEDAYTGTTPLGPGNDESIRIDMPAAALTTGTHTISYMVEAARAGTTAFKQYYTNGSSYAVPAPLAPFGDITKVTLDDKLLPESGTLGWVLNDDAAVKVFFRNTGNAASTFHIWLTDETGATLCDVTTAEVPADGAERYVVCGTFTPSIKKVKTLTAHITP